MGKKTGTKTNEYTELAVEVKKRWKQQKVEIVHIAISSTGAIPKALNSNLEELEFQPILAKLQKIAVLRTCSIVQRHNKCAKLSCTDVQHHRKARI